MSIHLSHLLTPWMRPLVPAPSWGPVGPVPPPCPVTLGGRLVCQVDSTSCGAAVLLMLKATGDGELAQKLEENPEQIGPLQRELKARALAQAPWPPSLGIPPWALAKAAEFPGVTYHPRPFIDRGERGRAVLNAVFTATNAGIPVPLYTGSDLRSGPAGAVPRHVVLAVPPPEPRNEALLSIYEPSRGMLHTVGLTDLMNRSEPMDALGGWTHVVWAILPRPRKERHGR